MSGLRARLTEATRAKAPVQQTALLPFDVSREFLETHPLVVFLDVNAQSVHTAVLDLVYHNSGALAATNEQIARALACLPPPDHRSSACLHCASGTVVFEAKEGHRVCNECGTVASLRALNAQPEFVPAVRDEDLAPPHKRARHVRGVAPWISSAAGSDEPRAEEDHWAELEHWNQFTYHPPDLLRKMNERLKQWKTHRYGKAIKLVAVLLEPLLTPQFQTHTEVRRALRQGTSLDVVRDPAPAPRFPCLRCGKRQATHKAARHHCRGLGARA